MKVLQIVKKNFAILGIDPSHQLNKKVHFGFLSIGCTITTQFVYIIYVANDFMGYMESICTISGTIIMFIFFATIVLKRIALFKSIDNIENIIDTRCKYPKSEAFFLKTSQQVDHLSEIVFTVLVKIAVQCFMLPKCVVSFFIYFFTDQGRDSFQLPFLMWLPFEWHSPVGYLIAVIFEYIILSYEYILNASIVALGIGAYWFAISGTKEIKHALHSINDTARTKKKKKQSIELKISFAEFIQGHAAIKHLEHDFSDILQPMIMSLFTWSLLAISAAMFIFQVEILHHGNVIPVLQNAIINGILGIIIVFIACELGQRMSEAFEKIELAIDQFDWYLFPIEIQRLLPFIIESAQEEVELECLGKIACTREVFRKILRCAYSYFTVLSQLGD